MEKLIIIYPCKEQYSAVKRTKYTTTGSNMDESQQQCAKRKKSVSHKMTYCLIPFIGTSRRDKAIVIESTQYLPEARGLELTAKGHGETFGEGVVIVHLKIVNFITHKLYLSDPDKKLGKWLSKDALSRLPRCQTYFPCPYYVTKVLFVMNGGIYPCQDVALFSCLSVDRKIPK